MKTPRLLLLATVILAGAAAAFPLGCFSLSEAPCAFSCVQPPHRCPEQYTCGGDGLCHREGSTGICTLTPPGDAGGDRPDSGPGDLDALADAAEAGGP